MSFMSTFEFKEFSFQRQQHLGKHLLKEQILEEEEVMDLIGINHETW